jgi:Lipase
LTQLGCNSSEKYAMIVHGWLESIEADWVHDLVVNLQRFRGGCIIFMDYSNHSIVQDYFVLVRKFDFLSQVLVEKLLQLEKQGFNPDNLFMYGFSFGAQLVINTGNLYGENRIAEIDGELMNQGWKSGKYLNGLMKKGVKSKVMAM